MEGYEDRIYGEIYYNNNDNNKECYFIQRINFPYADIISLEHRLNDFK